MGFHGVYDVKWELENELPFAYLLQFAMEVMGKLDDKHDDMMIHQLKMVISHSYVRYAEGIKCVCVLWMYSIGIGNKKHKFLGQYGVKRLMKIEK